MTLFTFTHPIPEEFGVCDLIQSDALAALKRMPSASVDGVCTSPPYYRKKNYRADGQIGLEPTLGEYFDYIRQIARELFRVATDDANLWWVIGDTFNGTGSSGGDYRNADGSYRMKVRGAREPQPYQTLLLIPEWTARMFPEEGWFPIMNITWDKGSHINHGPKRPNLSHECILLCCKSPEHYWDKGAVLQDGKPLGSVWDIPAGGQPRVWVDGERLKGKASFPLLLAEIMINLGCPPGGMALDPFCGFGTTLAAAAKWGRNAIGIELSEEACRASRERLRGRLIL